MGEGIGIGPDIPVAESTPAFRNTHSGGARMCRRASIATVRRDLPDRPD